MTRTRDTVLIGLLLIFTALLFDAVPLYVPGVALVVLGGACELWVRAAVGDVSVERVLTRTRVVEDEPLDVDVVIHSPVIGFPSGDLDDSFLDGRLIPLRPGRRVQHIRIKARFSRRGRRRLAAPTVVVRDPLGMTARTVTGTEDAEVLVLPRTEPLAIAARVRGDRPGPWLRTLAQAADVDLDGLRPYRTGTSASRIYWPGLARGGELSERRLNSGSDERALVVLDARAAHSQDLDAAVRAAASICRDLGERTGCRLLLPGMRRGLEIGPALRGWEAAHTQLALVEPGGRPSATMLAQRRGLLIWVTGERLQRPPEALLRSGAGTRVLVLPGEIAAGRPAFIVTGCTGYVLGAARQPGAGVAAATGALG